MTLFGQFSRPGRPGPGRGSRLWLGVALVGGAAVAGWATSLPARADGAATAAPWSARATAAFATDAARDRATGPGAGVRVKRDLRVTMRDGTRIALDVYRPDRPGRFPALYAVSPYPKDAVALPAHPVFPWRETGPIEWYVRQGFVYVLADARGSGRSEGEWRFLDALEQADLIDTIDWITRQPWSTGRLCMIGQSYYAAVQWLAARLAPPGLACIAPVDGITDPIRDGFVHGGIPTYFPAYWQAIVRHLNLQPQGFGRPRREMPFDLMHEVLARPLASPFWLERSAEPELARIEVPVLAVTTWSQLAHQLRGTLRGFEGVSGPRRLIVFDGDLLARFADPRFHRDVLLPWFERWLKDRVPDGDAGAAGNVPVRVFVRGAGRWAAFDQWPPATRTDRPLYLSGSPADAVRSLNDGSLVWGADGGGPAHTAYSYPQPSWVIGSVGYTAAGLPDPTAGVLSFTSVPLDRDLEIVGPVSLTLYAATTGQDTDFIVRLLDQEPRSVLRGVFADPFIGDLPPPGVVVSKGWLRASYRALDPKRSTPGRPYLSLTRREPLVPGRVYRFDIALRPAAYLFRRGHRIRLEIVNRDSPVTDGPFAHLAQERTGTDTLFHDAAHPSRLILPVTAESTPDDDSWWSGLF